MFGQLGDIVFDGPLGPDSLTIAGEETYAEHALINMRPKLDHTGTGLRTIAMGIQFHFSFCTPETQIAALWKHKTQADILTFVLGNGVVIGDFVITAISEAPQQTDPLGNYICAKLTVTLKECYTVDKSTQKQEAARAAAKAFSENGPTPVRQRSTEWITARWSLTEKLMEAVSIAAAIQNIVKYASVPEFWLMFSSQIGVYTDIALNANADAVDAWLSDAGLMSLCPDVGTALMASSTALSALQSAMPITSYSVLSSLNDDVQTTVAAAQAAATLIFIGVILRT